MDGKLAYSLKEAALQAGDSSTKTLRRQIDTGHLIAKRIGTKIVILRSDLEAWLESLPENPPGR